MLVIAAAMTLLAPAAAGAAWQEIVGGQSPIVHSPTTEAVNPSLADVDGTLYVAWEQHNGATDSEVRVSRLDGAGTAWVDVGGALSHTATDNAFRPNVASIGGVPWVAWIEYDGISQKVRVAKLNGAGTGWTEVVGGVNPINHDATQNAFDPCLADVGGVPYVAWAEEPQPQVAQARIRVSRLNDAGTAWTEVVGGTNPINQDASAQAGGPSLTSIGGVPYVAWQEGYGDPKIHVSKLDDAGTAWTELGSGPAPVNHDPDRYAASPSLTGIGGVPYVAWSEADDLLFQIRVARFDDPATGWTEVVGGAQPINLPGGGSGQHPSLTSIDGVPYVAFSQYDNNEEIRVKRFDNAAGAWIEVDGGASPINESPDLDGVTPSLTVSDGVPVVAWSQEEEASPMQIRVSRNVPAIANQWDRAWGQDVDSAAPETGFEICTVATDCTAGPFNGTAPGAVNHPEGIASGPENYVYLTGTDDQNKGLVSAYKPNGDYLASWGGAGTTGGKFAGFPHGIAVDGLGHLYVADTSGNRIQEFTTSGAFIRTWGWGVNGGSGFEVCTEAASCTTDAVGHGEGGGFRAPYGIAADGAGNVYVAEDDNRRVQKFTVTDGSVSFDRAWGADVLTSGGTGAEVCTVAASCKAGIDGAGKGGETGRAVAIAVDPDGDVYVAEGTNDRIEEFTPDGAFVRAIGKGVNGGAVGEICTSAASCKPGQFGTGDGEFGISSEGAGLAFRPGGVLYVADSTNDRIQVLTADGGFLRAFGAPAGHLGGQLAFPTALAVGLDNPDLLFVAAYNNRRVDKFVGGSSVPATFQFSAATYTVDEFFGAAEITVQRSGDTSAAATVKYATSNGTATAGSDYTAASGTLSFAAGETEKIFTVLMKDDQVQEADETVDLTLSSPTGGVLGSISTAVLTIVDDDALNTTITGGPNGLTVDKRPTFTFTSTPAGAQFQCRVDSTSPAAFTSCTSPWTVPADLSDGTHFIDVRAVTGGPPPTQVDPSPAQRVLNVDTHGPTTNLSLTKLSGDRTSPGVFTGAVRVDGSQTDPAPGIAGDETRCVLDPPSAPATFYDLPSALCPVATQAIGQHTVYAASRDLAGNTGPVVSKDFKILAVADTIIDSGPSGETWLLTPYFGFHATVAGSTFQCRVDGAAYGPCTNPFLSAALAPGNHSFDVRAISPDGVTDSTPAHRDFTILSASGHSYPDCTIQPFTHTSMTDPIGPPINACYIGPEIADWDRCGWDVKCVTRDTHCPMFTVCTVTTSSQWFDVDHGTRWASSVTANLGVDTNLDRAAYTTCDTGLDGDRCFATASDTDIVVPSSQYPDELVSRATGMCQAYRYQDSGSGTLGSDSIRRLECTVSISYQPLSALTATASGGRIQLFIPGAGTVTVAPGTTPLRATSSAESAEAKEQVFKPRTLQADADGVVSVKLKLGKKAKKKLRKHRRLRVTLTVSYSSPDGTEATKTSTVTLRMPPVGSPVITPGQPRP